MLGILVRWSRPHTRTHIRSTYGWWGLFFVDFLSILAMFILAHDLYLLLCNMNHLFRYTLSLWHVIWARIRKYCTSLASVVRIRVHVVLRIRAECSCNFFIAFYVCIGFGWDVLICDTRLINKRNIKWQIYFPLIFCSVIVLTHALMANINQQSIVNVSTVVWRAPKMAFP